MVKKSYVESSDDALKRYHKMKVFKNKFYIRMIVSLLFLSIFIFCLSFGIYREDSYNIDKREKGITDYRVYMNKDDVYTKDYQESGLSYVSSTIDYVLANYNYDLKYDKGVLINCNYEIKSTLVIRELGINGNVLYETEYQDNDTINSVSKVKKLSLNEDVKIDYKKYNAYVEDYKKKYGVSVDAEVKTVMVINEKSIYNDEEVFSETRELSTSVPLGEHTLKISVNNPIDSDAKLKGNKVIKFNLMFVCLSFIFGIVSFVCVFKTVSLFFKYQKLKTIYDVKLSKILKEYDRIIVETKATELNQKFKNVITVNRFEELVDVRDNTEEPILYVNIETGKHANFMIINNDSLYVYDFNIENMK